MIKSFFYPYLCPRGHTITPKLKFCPICCQKCSIRFNLIISNVWCQIVLVPNCPVPNCPGAKLSWCQIVRVPNCPLLLSWCQISPFLLSWCQIVRFIILVSNCPVPNCPVLNCPTIVTLILAMTKLGQRLLAKRGGYIDIVSI